MCSLTSRARYIPWRVQWRAPVDRIWQRVGLYVTVRVCISASRCRRPVATDRPPYFLSRGDRTGSELDPVESRLKLWRKRRPLFRTGGSGCSGSLSEFSPVPCRNRRGRRRRSRRRRRRRREGVGTRREEHGGPSLHGREFCTASAYRNLRREHRSGRRPQDTSLPRTLRASARSPRRRPAPPPPCSSSALLSLVPSPLLSFSLLPLRTLCSSLVSRFFFSPRKWTKLEAAARPLCPTAAPVLPYSWEALTLR